MDKLLSIEDQEVQRLNGAIWLPSASRHRSKQPFTWDEPPSKHPVLQTCRKPDLGILATVRLCACAVVRWCAGALVSE